MNCAAASSGRRRRCTGSTPIPAAACCSRASPKARAAFQQAFEARAVEKYYLAVVGSEIAEEQGVIDLPLGKTSSAEAGWRMVGDRAWA